jgi:hypothetical protein
MTHAILTHPTEIQLALFAGGDLGAWQRWRVRRHVSLCSGCEGQVQALRAASAQVREVAAELPKDLNWDRLSEEMTGNIRVGLAAGEAIARFDKPVLGRGSRRLGWNAALVLAGATAIFGIAFWTSLPQQQADNLLAAFRRIRAGRIGSLVPHPALVQEGAVLEASSSVIEVKENGRTFSLMNPRSDGVTVSISMKGSAGLRYVDADSGQVTTNKVYYAEQ